jgi:ketosteroid isomerase-like protein
MQASSTIEVFRKSVELLEKGDIDQWIELFDDDVVFEFPFAPKDRPSRFDSKTALSQHVRARAERMAAPKVEELKVYATDDPSFIVAEMVVKSISGQARRAIAVVTVRNGLITGYRDYWNPLDLKAAAEDALQLVERS